MAEFKNSILSLRNRAKRARSAVKAIGLIILAIVVYSFTFVAYRYTVKTSQPFENWAKSTTIQSKNKVTPFWRVNKDGSAEAIFNNRIEQVLVDSLGREIYDLDGWLFTSNPKDDKPAIKTDYDPKLLSQRLEPILSAYERYNKSKVQKPEPIADSKQTEYESIISSLMLSLGAVGFIILIIQTAVTFMRYYARLAELYEAQADALEASEGNPEVAYNFIEKFSPLGVEFGKLPITIYEKSFDSIVEIAKSKK